MTLIEEPDIDTLDYIYSFETNKEDKEFYVYPFTIVAPSYMENDLKEQIRKSTA